MPEAARPVIPNLAARRLFLHAHDLVSRKGEARPGLKERLSRLGFVQIDSVRAVERAHHHILHARERTYRAGQIERLAYGERAAFEHWTHDAAIIPIEFYPHWHHQFAYWRRRFETNAWWQKQLGDRRILKDVLRTVSDAGPTKARDLDLGGGRTGPWWGWKPAKAALEYLWHTGDLTTASRDGFEKVYDLAERVIPGPLLKPRPNRSETIAWACAAAIERLGFATPAELAAFFDLIDGQEAARWAASEVKAGRLIEADVEPAAGKPRKTLTTPETLNALAALPTPSGALRALSPFDPAIRDRQRAERLFGFDYRIEIFTPAPKRKYGYYVFPLLEGDRFVGRADLKADRARDALLVQGVWWEGGVRPTKDRLGRLEAEFARIAGLAGVGAVAWPAKGAADTER